MLNYIGSWFDVTYVLDDPVTGTVDLDELREKVSENTAAVYIENPGYLGVVQTRPEEISRIAHEKGALLIVSVNPASSACWRHRDSTARTSPVATVSRSGCRWRVVEPGSASLPAGTSTSSCTRCRC